MAEPAVKARYDELCLHPATLPRADDIACLRRDLKTRVDVVAKGNIKTNEN